MNKEKKMLGGVAQGVGPELKHQQKKKNPRLHSPPG
jgi:hypothetical protein